MNPSKPMYNDLRNFIGAETLVFWDTKECPVPADLDADTVVRNIRLSLWEMGYRGMPSITIFGDVNEMVIAFGSTGLAMGHVPAAKKGAVPKEILVEFLYESIGQEDRYLNLMLIMGDISRNQAFINAFDYLNMSSNLNVILAQPDNASKKLLRPVRTVWLWSSLSRGGGPLDDEEEAPEPSFKIRSYRELLGEFTDSSDSETE